MKKKLPVDGGMRVRTWTVLSDCVEDGIGYGWQRAHKHTDKPDEDALKEAIYDAVTGEISQYFSFDDQVDE